MTRANNPDQAATAAAEGFVASLPDATRSAVGEFFRANDLFADPAGFKAALDALDRPEVRAAVIGFTDIVKAPIVAYFAAKEQAERDAAAAEAARLAREAAQAEFAAAKEQANLAAARLARAAQVLEASHEEA